MRTALLLPLLIACLAATTPNITIQRVPSNGLEPAAIVDSTGVIHLLYFIGDPKAGDLAYCDSAPGAIKFTRGMSVNARPKSVTIVGAVRGPRMTLDRFNNPVFLWTGNEAAQSQPRLAGLPLLVESAGGVRGSHWPEHQVIPTGVGIDGGASIATTSDGAINIVWHAPSDAVGDEQSRKLWIARSTDDGKTFSSPATIDTPPRGACGCCAALAFPGNNNGLDILYRTADQLVHRDMVLVAFDATLKPTSTRTLSEWNIGKCVMSTSTASGGVIAWESEDHILIARTAGGPPIQLGAANKNPKHPRLATSGDFVLVAWTEQTAWNKGGTLAWQLLDRNLNPVADAGGHKDNLPTWDYPAAIAMHDGSFLILY